ncbi:MAG: T9SS type A sorting domain-containing protein [Candidatus Cloacimonadota bacterium]
MKTAVLTILIMLAFGLSYAQMEGFQELATGQFGGKLSSFVSGDSIYLVFRNYVDSQSPGSVVFKKTTDGGLNWVESVLDNNVVGLCIPTLSVDGNELIVTYKDGYEKYVARSIDQGQSWTFDNTGRTFEPSPLTVRMDGQYYKVDYEIPYPIETHEQFIDPASQEAYILPQYIVGEELSQNGTPVYYSGQDVITGGLRSNSDIWIKQSGGGTNGGWPTFLGQVIISGTVQSVSGEIPYDQVFLGGLIENAPSLSLPRAPRRYGTMFGGSYADDNVIIRIKVDHGTYTAWKGQKTNPYLVQVPVYNEYPADPLGEPVYQNSFAVQDTIWTPMASGTCLNQRLWTKNELWIEGVFEGNQSWASTDTVRIIGDITLAGTVPGEDPAPGSTDHVSLLSEKSVLLKYGYYNHLDSTRVQLCRADDDPLYIYADIYASGRSDIGGGVFSFEYQHPHPSVPDLNYLGQSWTGIDLHRRRFPQTTAEPWPAHIDFPFYNPLWPEAKPYLERGKVELHGSVVQFRRGYMHRPLYDTEWPSNGVWNIPLDYCGGTSAVNYADPILGINLQTVNYPGATGSGIGYKKDYHYNPASVYGGVYGSTVIDSPVWWSLGLGLDLETFEPPQYDYYWWCFTGIVEPYRTKTYARNQSSSLFAGNSSIYLQTGNEVEDISDLLDDELDIQSISMNDNRALIYCSENGTQNNQAIYELNLETEELESSTVFAPASSSLNDVAILPDGRYFFVSYSLTDHSLKVSRYLDGTIMEPIGVFPLNGLAYDQLFTMSKLSVQPISNNDLEIMISKCIQGGTAHSYTLYRTRLHFQPSDSGEEVAVIPAVELRAYPNPSRGMVNLELKTNEAHRIDIFNIRGQRVASLSEGASSQDGTFLYNWNGLDRSGQRLASGVYLMKVFVGDKPRLTKRICLY